MSLAAPLFRVPAALERGAGLLKPTVFLFAVDTFANLVDYLFHIYLGRALLPAEFGVFQTVNSALLIAVTAFGVMQPVLARTLAAAGPRRVEAPAASAPRSSAAPGGDALPEGESAALFRTYLRWSLLFGLGLGAVLLAAAGPVAALLNVPAYTVRYAAAAIVLILVRPVVAGTLQGAERFVPFGLTRLGFALGRLAFAAAALALGAGLAGAVASLPVGQLLAVGVGMAFLGAGVFRGRGQAAPNAAVRDGFRLAGWAFAAYAAFTALQSLDLLWVNRHFSPEASGAYAAAVLLRRILILFPGAAAVVMYPRIVAQVVGGRVPDRLLGWTLAIVVVPLAALAAVYAAAGPAVVALAFGPGYEAAGPLLGGMGVAMVGYGIASIWLNVFLATRPAAFALLLAGSAVVEAAGLTIWHADLAQVVAVFAAGGWLPAIGGAVLYWFRLRPGLRAVRVG